MKKVLFVGGGTLGPVTPLLAVYEAWKAREKNLVALWVGTQKGPERAFVEQEGIPFFSLAQARFVRYPSKEWLLLPFRFVLACMQAYVIVRKEKPDVIAAAG